MVEEDIAVGDHSAQSVMNIIGWHLHTKWSLILWMEMIFKVAGVITILISLSTISPSLRISLIRVVELCLFSPLLLCFIVLLLSAFSSKELFSFFFTIISFISHLSIIPLLLFGNPGISLTLFCCLMCVGEAYRLVFFNSNEAKLAPQSGKRRKMITGFVFVFVIVYLVVMALETTSLIQINKGV